jgi:hypothetical protein
MRSDRAAIAAAAGHASYAPFSTVAARRPRPYDWENDR